MSCEGVFGHGGALPPEAVSGLVHRELAPTPRSAAEARRFVDETLASDGHLDDEVRSTLLLLTSELVTNGVLHARTTLQLGACRHGDQLLVCVSDGNRLRPVEQVAGEEGVSGRGMLLVRSLAECSGTDERPDGKTVWFTLRADGERG